MASAIRRHRGYVSIEMKQQDEILDEFGDIVGELKQSAENIKDSLEDGNAELHNMRQDMDNVEKNFASVSVKIKKTLDTDGISQNRTTCCIHGKLCIANCCAADNCILYTVVVLSFLAILFFLPLVFA